MKTPHQKLPSANERKDRLKAALKVNMKRRKEQAKARASAPKGGAAATSEQKE